MRRDVIDIHETLYHACRFLLEEKELGTDVNQADEFGITPLMHACIVNSEPIVRLLFNPKCFIKRSGDRSIVSQPPTSVPLYGHRKRKVCLLFVAGH